MNILLLSNSAPNYFHFFNPLVQNFSEDGSNIVIAVDSIFSRRENELDSLGFDIHVFSEFFARHEVNSELLARYAAFNLNAALLSDYERAKAYGIWGDKVDSAFFDKLKSALLTFFESIFQRYGISAVVYENVSNAFAHFAYFVAKKNGAVYLGVGGSRLPGRFSVTSDPLNDDAMASEFSAILLGHSKVPLTVRRWAADYIENIESIVPDYMKSNGLDRIGLLSKYLTLGRARKVKSVLRHAFDDRLDAFQIGNPLRTHLGLFVRNIRRRLKIGKLRKLYQKPVLREKFLLYPLHFHPESSTSILAGAYLNEYEVIRNIAFNLPEGVRLYVKDHISAWGYPALDFYRSLRSLPNVYLLEPNAPTKQLIKASAGVITLTSTVGYEALLLKTRVFLYGRVFYEWADSSTRCNKDECGDRWLRMQGIMAA